MSIRYFTNKRGFQDGTAYLAFDGQNGWGMNKDGNTFAPGSWIDLAFALESVADGDWIEIPEAVINVPKLDIKPPETPAPSIPDAALIYFDGEKAYLCDQTARIQELEKHLAEAHRSKKNWQKKVKKLHKKMYSLQSSVQRAWAVVGDRNKALQDRDVDAEEKGLIDRRQLVRYWHGQTHKAWDDIKGLREELATEKTIGRATAAANDKLRAQVGLLERAAEELRNAVRDCQMKMQQKLNKAEGVIYDLKTGNTMSVLEEDCADARKERDYWHDRHQQCAKSLLKSIDESKERKARIHELEKQNKMYGRKIMVMLNALSMREAVAELRELNKEIDN
jgi:uncharacterized coiled-coil protein SlyX